MLWWPSRIRILAATVLLFSFSKTLYHNCFSPPRSKWYLWGQSWLLCLISPAYMSWSTVNRLKFNEEKTEFLVAISDHLKHLLPHMTLRIGTLRGMDPSESVRNLGIVFDTSMTMNAQITSLCTSLTTRCAISHESEDSLTRTYAILSFALWFLPGLTMANALLFVSNATDIQRLQRKQNWAAKLVCRASKRDHATLILCV